VNARAAHGILLGLVGALAVAAVGGIVLLYRVPERPPGPPVESAALLDATVLSVVPAAIAEPVPLSPGAVEVTVAARIDATDQVVTFDQVDETGDTLREGQRVRLSVSEAPGQPPFYGIQAGNPNCRSSADSGLAAAGPFSSASGAECF